MKKEIIAGCILLLILIASFVNIWFINDKTEELSAQIAQAGEHFENGETEKATEAFTSSLEDWKKLNRYVHIMLRHDEIDPITNEFYLVLEELEKGEATQVSFENLRDNLEKLAEMERLSLSAIF